MSSPTPVVIKTPETATTAPPTTAEPAPRTVLTNRAAGRLRARRALADVAADAPEDVGLAEAVAERTEQDDADLRRAAFAIAVPSRRIAPAPRGAVPVDVGLEETRAERTAQDEAEVRAAATPIAVLQHRLAPAAAPAGATVRPQHDVLRQDALTEGTKQATDAAVAGVPITQSGQPQTLTEWSANVETAAATMSKPSVIARHGVFAPVVQKSQERNEKAQDEVTRSSGRYAPRFPRPPELPKPPPDPVPEATKKVTDAVEKALPDLTLPPLERTPMGRLPTLVPPPAPPKEAAPPASATGAKVPATPARIAPQGQPLAAEVMVGPPMPPPTLKDVRLPLGRPLRPDLAMRVGDVVGKLLGEIEPMADEVLKAARGSAFRGGLLVTRFPELDEPIRTPLVKALTEQVQLIGDLSGIGRERIETAAKNRADALASSKVAATVPTENEAKAAADAIKKEERKTAEAIAHGRANALKETTQRMQKALTSVNPQFITEIQDELIANLRTQDTRGAAQQRRAAAKRAEQLARLERQYGDAYRRADNADIPGTLRGVGAVNLDPATKRPWLDVRLEEVAATFKQATEEANKTGEQLAAATEAAGLEAYELVRVWAVERLGQERSIDSILIDKFADLRAQADRRALAEAEVKAQEANNALVGDIMLIDVLAQADATAADATEKQRAIELTEEERESAEKYFGFGTGARDPLMALARTTRGRLVQERLPDLTDQFRTTVKALDPFSFGKEQSKLDDLSAVLFGDPGGAAQITSRLFAAMDIVGTDEQAIYDALAGLTPEQTALVRAQYLVTHEHTLEWALRDEMSGSELDRALALAKGDKIAAAAEAIFDAVDGLGTNEELVYSTLRNLSPEDLDKVKAYYLLHHKESLESALRSDFSDRELSRALALAAGDKNKADAYAIDEALQGSIWGPDREGLEQVHKQIATDVGEANPNMTSEELAIEVRRRTGEVEASYETWPGAGKTLKQVYAEKLEGPTRDLAIALVDNDQDGADAARFAIEAKAAQSEARQDADDQFNDILKARHGRMLDKARRDNYPRLAEELRKEIDQRAAQGNPMTPWDRQKRERDIQVQIGTIAQGLSQEGMSTLEKRFDEAYTGTWQKYDPNTGEVATHRGGFRVMSELLSSGPETKDYLKKGHLTLAEEIRYSVEGAGTNEQRLTSVTKGRTKAEIAQAREEYKERWHEDMDERIHDEVDWGTRDRFDIDENLRGAPENPQEMLESAKRRYTFETTTYGAGGLFELAPEARRVLDEDYRRVQQSYERLNDPDPRKRPTGAELDDIYGRFESRVKTFEVSTDTYRKSVDSMVDAIVQVVAAAVAIIVIAATWGSATPLVAAVYGSLWGTAATITAKIVLLGNAYGLEDFGKDLALGAVDAAIAAATAGVGDKLLKAAEGAANPGVLARMAASSSRATRIAAKASAEVLEQAAQAAPNALANTLLDDNTYRGDVFKNILKGTVTGTVQGVGQGLVMGAAMKVGIHMAGTMTAGWRSLRGLPPPDAIAVVESARSTAMEHARRPDEPADVLGMRGTVQERAAAWAEFRSKYPGASYERDFLPALDRGTAALVARADAAHQFQRQMRAELLSAVPPELRGQFADTPIHVVSDADFEAFGRSKTGQAIVVIEDGQPRVIVRESAGPGVLREEGIHLWQSVDPRMHGQVAALDERRLGRWDSLTVGEKIDLYRTKLDVEIDGQHRLLAHLDGELKATSLDPETRAMLESDVAQAQQTLENLHAIEKSVDVLGASDLLRISRGELRSPVDLDQPSRLFAKKQPAARTERRKAAWEQISEQDAAAAFGDIVPVHDLPGSRKAKNAYRIGPEFHIGGDGPYRHVMWETQTGKLEFTAEKRDVNGRWVERGERRRTRGLSLEREASAELTRTQAAAAPPRERYIPLDRSKLGVVGPGGFDEVILVLKPDGTAVIKLVEVKNVNGYVSWAEITAVDDAMRQNVGALRSELTANLAELAKAHNLSSADMAAISSALLPRRTQIEVEFRLGPNAKMAAVNPDGSLKTGSVAAKLEADLRRRYGSGVKVLPPVQISQEMVDAARINLTSKPSKAREFERVGQLAITPTGVTPESAQRAQALARAEVDNPDLLGFVQQSGYPPGFFSQAGQPIDVMRPNAQPRGFDPRRLAADIMARLEQPQWNMKRTTRESPQLVVDWGALTPTQEALVKIEIKLLAQAKSASAAVSTRLHDVRTAL